MIEIRRDGSIVAIMAGEHEIITQSGNGEKCSCYYNDSGLISYSGGARYEYDKGGMCTMVLEENGSCSLKRFDPYGNTIGVYQPSGFGRCIRISTYTYHKLEDGTVASEYKNRTNLNSYAEWLDALPTEFPVAEYVKPVKKARADDWYDIDKDLNWMPYGSSSNRYLRERMVAQTEAQAQLSRETLDRYYQMLTGSVPFEPTAIRHEGTPDRYSI